MIYQSRAIVLRTVKYGESSLIVDLFTEQKGHQTVIINSVRKTKALTHASVLQLMSLVEIIAYYREHHKINRVKEVRPAYTWQSIPFDMRKSAVITCLAEVCSKCVTTADPHRELFAFLHDELIAYDQAEFFDRDFLIRFLIRLARFLGFGMEIPLIRVEEGYFDLLDGQYVLSKPSHTYFMQAVDLYSLRMILNSGRHKIAEVTHEVRRRLVDNMILYYQLHIETLKDVQSLRVLREVL